MLEYIGVFFVCFWFNLPFWYLMIGMHPPLAYPSLNLKAAIAILIVSAGIAGAASGLPLVNCISRGGVTALSSLSAYLFLTQLEIVSKPKRKEKEKK